MAWSRTQERTAISFMIWAPFRSPPALIRASSAGPPDSGPLVMPSPGSGTSFWGSTRSRRVVSGSRSDDSKSRRLQSHPPASGEPRRAFSTAGDQRAGALAGHEAQFAPLYDALAMGPSAGGGLHLSPRPNRSTGPHGHRHVGRLGGTHPAAVRGVVDPRVHGGRERHCVRPRASRRTSITKVTGQVNAGPTGQLFKGASNQPKQRPAIVGRRAGQIVWRSTIGKWSRARMPGV